MVEHKYGGTRNDARGGGRGGGRGDPQNEEAARQRDLRDEIDDLRQHVRDLQRDIEIGDLRRQVRDLQRREKRRGKSNPMSSTAPEHHSMDDPLFNDVCGGQSKPIYDEDVLSMPVYDEPVYDEDILSMPVYDEPVYDEDILSMPVYDKPVYDEDIFYELPGLISKYPHPSVKFDDPSEDEGVAVDDDEEYDEAEGGNRLLELMFENVDSVGDKPAYDEDPHHHALDHNPSVLMVGRCGEGLDSTGVLSIVDAYTREECNHMKLVHSIVHIIPLSFTNSLEQRLHLLLDANRRAHFYPRPAEALDIFQRESGNIYWYSAETDEYTLKGT